MAPLEWVREPTSSVDAYDRSRESYGICTSQGSSTVVITCIVLLAAINISALLFANYQAYLSRKIPTEFSESTYIAISMVVMLEAFVLAGPILFMTRENPTSFFLSWTVLVTISCLAIQLPMFVPKFIHRRRIFHNEKLIRKGQTPSSLSIPTRRVAARSSASQDENRVSTGTNNTSHNKSSTFAFSPPSLSRTRGVHISGLSEKSSVIKES